MVREADGDFVRVQQLLREVQAAGGVSMRVEEDKARGSTAALFFQRDDLPADIQEKSAEIRRLLKLKADQPKFVLTYSPMRGGDDELAVNSRSLLQILQAFSSYVEVPEQDLQNKVVAPSLAHTETTQRPVGQIRSGPTRPETDYVAVQYRGQWFWVDHSDWLTKRALTVASRGVVYES
jgi:hypothetical protein